MVLTTFTLIENLWSQSLNTFIYGYQKKELEHLLRINVILYYFVVSPVSSFLSLSLYYPLSLSLSVNAPSLSLCYPLSLSLSLCYSLSFPPSLSLPLSFSVAFSLSLLRNLW